MVFKRLRNLTPRRAGRDQSAADGAAEDVGAVALLDDPAGAPPVLRPAAIFRQVLFDPAAELTPVWARPRPASAPLAASSSAATVEESAVVGVAPSVEPRPAKRTPRAKAKDSSAAAPKRSKKAAKPDQRTTTG